MPNRRLHLEFLYSSSFNTICAFVIRSPCTPRICYRYSPLTLVLLFRQMPETWFPLIFLHALDEIEAAVLFNNFANLSWMKVGSLELPDFWRCACGYPGCITAP